MTLVQPAPSASRPHASAADVRQALAVLGGVDLQRIGRIAKMRSAPVPGLDWEDLLHEAFARILGGKRRWPREVPLVAFFAQVMRSIASDHLRGVIEAPLMSDVGPAGADVAWERVADDAPLPGSALAARQVLTAIYNYFAKDEAVLAFISGIQCGETALETAVRTGLDRQAYDAARKRFDRGIQRFVCEGKVI